MKQMEELYLNYAKTVHKYLICLTNDVNIAEDLTQETFIKPRKLLKILKVNVKYRCGYVKLQSILGTSIWKKIKNIIVILTKIYHLKL